MRTFRFFIVIAIAVLMGSVLLGPRMADALQGFNAPGGAAAIATPAPTPFAVATMTATAASTTVTASFPGSYTPTDGDVVVGITSGLSATGFKATNGLTWVWNDITNNNHNAIWEHIVNAGDGWTSVTFNNATSGRTTICGVVYRNVLMNWDEANYTWQNGLAVNSANGVNPRANGITTVFDNSLYLNLFGVNQTATAVATAFSGFTMDATVDSSATVAGCGVESYVSPKGGSQGAVGPTLSNGNGTALTMIAHAAGTPDPAPTATPTPAFDVASSGLITTGQQSIAWPVGIKNLDWVFGVLSDLPSANGGTPMGSNLMVTANMNTANINVYFFHQYHTGDAPLTFSNVSGATAYCMAAYSGLSGNLDSSTSSLDSNNSSTTSYIKFNIASATTATGPGLTTTANNDMLVLMDANSQGAVVSVNTPATGYTQRVNQASGVSNGGCEIEDKLKATAGAETGPQIGFSAASGQATMGLFPMSPR